MSHRLWKTEKSSVVHRTESVSMIHHGRSVVVSSTAADQTQRNFFFRILPVWFVELPGRRVLRSGGDIGCQLLRRKRTSQPDNLWWSCLTEALVDQYTPPTAEVVANVVAAYNTLPGRWSDEPTDMVSLRRRVETATRDLQGTVLLVCVSLFVMNISNRWTVFWDHTVTFRVTLDQLAKNVKIIRSTRTYLFGSTLQWTQIFFT